MWSNMMSSDKTTVSGMILIVHFSLTQISDFSAKQDLLKMNHFDLMIWSSVEEAVHLLSL